MTTSFGVRPTSPKRRFARCFASLALAGFAASFTADATAQPVDAPTNVDQSKLDQARQHMQAGAAFYNDPSGHKCEEALREFTTAYQLSGSLNALRGMGICALELERNGEAIAYLDRYLQGKGGVEDSDKQLDTDLRALKTVTAQVQFTVDRKARILAERTPARGFPIRNRYEVAPPGLTLGLHPGQYKITASTEGAPEKTWSVEIENAGSYQHEFLWEPKGATPGPTPSPMPGPDTPEPEPTASSGDGSIPTTVWIFGGLTAALAIPTVIFMASAASARSDFDAANGAAPQAELDDLRSNVVTMNVLSDVFLVSTLAAGAATAVFFFTRDTGDSATGQGPSVHVLPSVGREGGGAVVYGTF